MQEKAKTSPQPMTLKELSVLYDRNEKTVKKWLKKIGINEPFSGYIYSINQVKEIFEKIGEPS